ncbi:MAG: diguanylate cyclase [Pyrinomonadaceae bacterium]
MKFPFPLQESARLAALYDHQILDTLGESEYDDITLLAAQICKTPIALISLVDDSRLWFKSSVGIDIQEMPREDAFCSFAITMPHETMVVADTLEDDRFSTHPAVTGDPNIRFYAGAPLLTNDNLALGTLCVMDSKPRELTRQQVEALQALARQLSLRLELRRTTRQLRIANEELKNLTLTDDLTGLYNRRGFFVHAERQLRVFRSRPSENSLWLMLGDLDGLKAINDGYGHPEGSAAIRKTAEILRQTFRDADIIARPGGDEFTVLIPNSADEVAKSIPVRLQANFDAYNSNSGKPYKIALSVGLVKVGYDEELTINQLLKAADEAMYNDKRRRKMVKQDESFAAR